jgi:carboxypeptidase family protein
LCATLLFCEGVLAQTASTGALLGQVLDPTGRGVGQASVEAKNGDRSISRLAVTDEDGRFVLPLLPPGTYQLTIARDGFLTQSISVQVPVSESVRITASMKIAGRKETVQIHASVSELQRDSVTLGRVVDSSMIQGLPLASRNFTQIVDLSPGVSTGVNNAGELGPGGSGLAQIDAGNDGIFVHGSRSYDNSYEFDGVPVTDLQASNIASGGIPIPSPDAIQEFKVQTGLYNVTFGEHAGASVSLVTKSGTNEIHGSLFEFLRNNVFNANDFFRNLAHQPRADLKQNQFGGTVGGPFLKHRLYYFGSYQGTRQVNGFAAGQARIGCSATVIMPPLTNDRSPQALGALFGGMSGAFGGVAVKSDGSNINPVALELLNFKLPDGSYLIPSPQVINPSLPLASQGLSTISTPCSYNADQVLANLDATLSPSSSLAARFIWSDGGMNVTFPGNGLNGNGNISGFPSDIDNRFVVLSASWTRLVAQQLLNQLRFGYTNTYGSTTAQAPFEWSDVGVSAGTLSDQDSLPSLGIVGSINLASGFPRSFNQKRFYFSDFLTYAHSKHFIQMGGSLSRIHDDINIAGVGTLAEFLSWPDFLLGLDATQNGTNLFSNIYESVDVSGLLDRKYRSWNGSVFVGDHFRATNAFTLDVGLRYERLGQYGDALGRNASFDISQSDFNPPASGSLAGYVVASNYQYPIPAGVVRSGNDSATLGKGQNGLAPRIGLAWQPTPWTSHVVIRAGYGIYYSQTTGQAFFQGVFGAPFSFGAANAGIANAEASFSHPFPEPFPNADFFPYFPAYSPTSNVSIEAVSPEFRPAMVQQFGLNSQVELAKDWLLEIGYVGQRGTHLLSFSSPNQALSASPANPIRGVVSNTLANIGQRVPVQGVPADSLEMIASDGTSWYNGLELSVSKHLSNGFEMLASYTFSKTLDSDGSNINGISAGNTLPLGNQDFAAQRWGRASFDRTHRFIFSAIYVLPSPSTGLAKAFFGGWSTSGVMTWQSGTALTIAYHNLTNVFGISEDRAELAPGCNKSNLVRGGSITSKLDEYFNTACFTTPPVIGADGIATAFGDSGTGIVDGPGQFNIDAAMMRRFLLRWPKEGSQLQIRAEAFNLLNHPQFSNPNTTYGSPSFGIISSTSVNPRVGQLALKMIF